MMLRIVREKDNILLYTNELRNSFNDRKYSK